MILLPALSVRQPWAWAIVEAGKSVENRQRSDGRAPTFIKHRGRTLIHASSKRDRDYHRWASTWMQGRLGICPPRVEELEYGGIVGICNVVGHAMPNGYGADWLVDELPSNFNPRWYMIGSWGLLLAEQRRLEFLKYPGALGIFKVRIDLPPEAS